jgi:hypothetical protein
MMTGQKIRPWTGRFRWPGKSEFRAGTVTVALPDDTPHHAVLAAVEAEFARFWSDILPNDFARPDLIALEPGALFFAPDLKP